MSLFDLPVARSARVARVAVVLILDLILAGSGIAMGLSWWSARNAVAAPEAPQPEPQPPEIAATPEPPEPPPPEVEVEEPRELPKKKPGAGSGSRPAPPIVPPAWPGSVDATPLTPPPAPSPSPEPPPAPASAPDAAPAPPPEVTVDDEGAEVSSEAVRNVVHQHMGDVKRCYTRNAKVGTNAQPIEGKVEIQFTIRTTGDAEEVRVVENSTGSEALGTCVAALISSWKFPSPGEDVEFVWPFVFKAPK